MRHRIFLTVHGALQMYTCHCLLCRLFIYIQLTLFRYLLYKIGLIASDIWEIFIMRSTKFKCSLDHAKKSFYRSDNGILVKSAELPQRKWYYTSKCLPVLLYDLEVCPLTKSDLQSLDFVVNRFLMKLYKNSNYEIICECQNYL